ncbi:hypothetical protein MNBD_ALPHA09-904 [hydrothermal vent metagenome]|uniref:L,D-TPase catalytic domain-containing protein n=1 Tax=hydrothermal vent metagenome TaxID=652676 RepID=A0A3B0SYP5_9ZZZZ
MVRFGSLTANPVKPGVTRLGSPLGSLTRATALAAIATGIAFGGVAQAGFVPPSVWQSQATAPSQDILADRAVLMGTIGSALSETGQLNQKESWALSIFYQSNDFTLVWMDGTTPSAAARDLVGVLKDAGSHALRAGDYAVAVDSIGRVGPTSTLADRAAADVALSKAALLYARHASAGRVNPRKITRNNTIDPVAADPAATLAALVSAEKPGDLLEALNPQSGDYKVLREAYIALLAIGGGPEPTVVPKGRTLKQGMKDARIVALRKRLVETKDLDAAQAPDSTVYDETLFAAVKAFQAKKGLPSEGIVGPMTLAALNQTSGDRLKKLAVNMERRRWDPEDRGAFRVFVNTAAFRLKVVKDGEIIHTDDVIVGKAKYQTPAFSDQFKRVVFNPYWNVPGGIAKREFLPLVRKDPSIMARRGFETLVSSGGRFVPTDLTRINWSSPEAKRIRIRFRQPPGAKNALGRVKFLFPNEHAVYLHDTPARSLFRPVSRAFSAGCVRVKNPMEFAEILLKQDGWNRKRIDRAVASRKNQGVNLKAEIYVQLAYWTAYVDENGELQYRDDVYGRDKLLAKALELDENAIKLAQLVGN